jgi:hypothetical protein
VGCGLRDKMSAVAEVLKTWSCGEVYSVIRVCGGHMFLTLKFCCHLMEVYGDGIMRVQCVRKWLNGHP